MINPDDKTKRHSVSPFSHIPSHKNSDALAHEFVAEWVIPYYMHVAAYNGDGWIGELKRIKTNITKDLVLSLLGDFNWRTRKMGAYFAAVKGYTDLTDIIGTHLLKNEVCCVGHIYALVLAFLNTEKSNGYLHTYIDYYLTKQTGSSDLYFALGAVLYLDKINHTANFGRYKEPLEVFQQKSDREYERFAVALAEMVKNSKGGTVEEHLATIASAKEARNKDYFHTDFFEKQIAILKEIIAA